jgi:RHS repeat-associated protein
MTEFDFCASRYTGKERDAESGLDYLGARYYGSSMGRFMSPDPENLSAVFHPDDPQSWNGYSYSRNNPLKFTDPTGMNYQVCDANGQNCSNVDDKTFEANQAADQKWGAVFQRDDFSA